MLQYKIICYYSSILLQKRNGYFLPVDLLLLCIILLLFYVAENYGIKKDIKIIFKKAPIFPSEHSNLRQQKF